MLAPPIRVEGQVLIPAMIIRVLVVGLLLASIFSVMMFRAFRALTWFLWCLRMVVVPIPRIVVVVRITARMPLTILPSGIHHCHYGGGGEVHRIPFSYAQVPETSTANVEAVDGVEWVGVGVGVAAGDGVGG